MGMGWKNVSGGQYTTGKCKCGKGKVVIFVSDHEESEYPPFERGNVYSAKLICPNNCMDVSDMSQNDMEYYNSSLL
ncbi:MAG: hypothetical protein RR628_02585 [Clostridium sp.]